MDEESVSGFAPQLMAVTLRGFLVGCLMSVIIAIGIPYGGMVIQGSRLGLSSCTPAAFFLLFLLLLTVHILLGLIKRRWAFQRGELITIFAMMTVATAIPTRGVVGMLLPMMTGTFYFATPENQWAHLLHPILTDWMVINDAEAVKGFYEGSSGQTSIPWNIWLTPLLRWLAFYASLYLTLISALVILRRQWTDYERLVYPLVQVPLAMIQDDDKGNLLKPLFKNWIMWIGFAIPFLINSINSLHHYFQVFAPISLATSISLFRDMVTLHIRVNLLMFGFAYFISTNLSFSLWFFYLINLLQEGLFSVLGIHSPEELGPWTGSGPIGAIMGHQMMGALIVLVGFGLWTARSHLRQVLRKAFDKDDPLDDSGEVMSYRNAVVGFVAGSVIMWFWLWKSGIPPWIAPFFILSALVIFIGLARVIAEAGLPTVTPEMVPAGFVVSGFGVPALMAKGMMATGYTFAWAGDLLVFMAAPLANVLRLGSGITRGQRAMLGAIVTAMLISLVVSTWFLLYLAYRDGALNLHRQYFGDFAAYPSSFAAQKIANPTGPSLLGWLWTAVGSTIMGGLMIARHKFIWWPLHPLGFAVSMGWVMVSIWFSIFLAWLIKAVVLKYGGPSLYGTIRPLFLGIVLGQFVVAGFWLIIDGLTGTVGNSIPVY